ncbi:hypothetical protein MAR_032516 [Mya arenaria]|uniref:Uncharacterized protein n=1 Tax=Mya arenaria TaxID=6604 RepID=A0ABY7FA78_MYAAR|nr:hypothetical protein MAR_032516 [Mya arenaria]
MRETEMQVKYKKMEMENGKKTDDNGKKTDYVCKIGDTIIGVSVTRARSYFIDRAKKIAEKYPDRNILPGKPFSLEDAIKLLKKKLECINESNRYSLENWTKQLLHVWSAENDISDKLEQAFHNLERLEPELVSNTVLLITTTTGTACDFIYMNDRKSMQNEQCYVGDNR